VTRASLTWRCAALSHQRRITSPVFSGSSVRALHGIMVEETQHLFSALDAKPKGTPFDADDLFCRLTLVRSTFQRTAHAPRTTHHAPRTTHHAPRTTHHAPRTTLTRIALCRT
jgi:cytochrome P450